MRVGRDAATRGRVVYASRALGRHLGQTLRGNRTPVGPTAVQGDKPGLPRGAPEAALMHPRKGCVRPLARVARSGPGRSGEIQGTRSSARPLAFGEGKRAEDGPAPAPEDKARGRFRMSAGLFDK